MEANQKVIIQQKINEYVESDIFNKIILNKDNKNNYDISIFNSNFVKHLFFDIYLKDGDGNNMLQVSNVFSHLLKIFIDDFPKNHLTPVAKNAPNSVARNPLAENGPNAFARNPLAGNGPNAVAENVRNPRNPLAGNGPNAVAENVRNPRNPLVRNSPLAKNGLQNVNKAYLNKINELIKNAFLIYNNQISGGNNGNYNKYITDIIDYITENNEILLFGGWTYNSSHALSLYIYKNPNNRNNFNLQIINSGLGTNYHYFDDNGPNFSKNIKTILDTDLKTNIIIEASNINLEQLTSILHIQKKNISHLDGFKKYYEIASNINIDEKIIDSKKTLEENNRNIDNYIASFIAKKRGERLNQSDERFITSLNNFKIDEYRVNILYGDFVPTKEPHVEYYELIFNIVDKNEFKPIFIDYKQFSGSCSFFSLFYFIKYCIIKKENRENNIIIDGSNRDSLFNIFVRYIKNYVLQYILQHLNLKIMIASNQLQIDDILDKHDYNIYINNCFLLFRDKDISTELKEQLKESLVTIYEKSCKKKFNKLLKTNIGNAIISNIYHKYKILINNFDIANEVSLYLIEDIVTIYNNITFKNNPIMYNKIINFIHILIYNYSKHIFSSNKNYDIKYKLNQYSTPQKLILPSLRRLLSTHTNYYDYKKIKFSTHKNKFKSNELNLILFLILTNSQSLFYSAFGIDFNTNISFIKKEEIYISTIKKLFKPSNVDNLKRIIYAYDEIKYKFTNDLFICNYLLNIPLNIIHKSLLLGSIFLPNSSMPRNSNPYITSLIYNLNSTSLNINRLNKEFNYLKTYLNHNISIDSFVKLTNDKSLQYYSKLNDNALINFPQYSDYIKNKNIYQLNNNHLSDYIPNVVNHMVFNNYFTLYHYSNFISFIIKHSENLNDIHFSIYSKINPSSRMKNIIFNYFNLFEQTSSLNIELNFFSNIDIDAFIDQIPYIIENYDYTFIEIFNYVIRYNKKKINEYGNFYEKVLSKITKNYIIEYINHNFYKYITLLEEENNIDIYEIDYNIFFNILNNEPNSNKVIDNIYMSLINKDNKHIQVDEEEIDEEEVNEEAKNGTKEKAESEEKIGLEEKDESEEKYKIITFNNDFIKKYKYLFEQELNINYLYILKKYNFRSGLPNMYYLNEYNEEIIFQPKKYSNDFYLHFKYTNNENSNYIIVDNLKNAFFSSLMTYNNKINYITNIFDSISENYLILYNNVEDGKPKIKIILLNHNHYEINIDLHNITLFDKLKNKYYKIVTCEELKNKHILQVFIAGINNGFILKDEFENYFTILFINKYMIENELKYVLYKNSKPYYIHKGNNDENFTKKLINNIDKINNKIRSTLNIIPFHFSFLFFKNYNFESLLILFFTFIFSKNITYTNFIYTTFKEIYLHNHTNINKNDKIYHLTLLFNYLVDNELIDIPYWFSLNELNSNKNKKNENSINNETMNKIKSMILFKTENIIPLNKHNNVLYTFLSEVHNIVKSFFDTIIISRETKNELKRQSTNLNEFINDLFYYNNSTVNVKNRLLASNFKTKIINQLNHINGQNHKITNIDFLNIIFTSENDYHKNVFFYIFNHNILEETNSNTIFDKYYSLYSLNNIILHNSYYLYLKVYLNNLLNISNELSNIINSPTNNLLLNNKALLGEIYKLIDDNVILSHTPMYNKSGTLIYKNSEEIIFEIENGYYIRKQQYAFINSLYQSNNNDKAYQLLMGRGKTNLITPIMILNKIYNLQNNHTCNKYSIILPESLVNQSYKSFIPYIKYLNNVTLQVFDNTYELVQESKKRASDYITNFSEENKIKIISDTYIKTFVLLNIDKSSKFFKNNFIIMDEIDSMIDPLKSNLNIINGTPSVLENITTIFDIYWNFYTSDNQKQKEIIRSLESENNVSKVIYKSIQFIKSKNYNGNNGYGFGDYTYFKNLPIHKNFNHFICVPYLNNHDPINSSKFTDIELTICGTINSYIKEWNHTIRFTDFLLMIDRYHNKNKSNVIEILDISFGNFYYPLIYDFLNENNIKDLVSLYEMNNIIELKKVYKNTYFVKYKNMNNVQQNDLLKEYLTKIIFPLFILVDRSHNNISFIDIMEMAKNKIMFTGTVDFMTPIKAFNTILPKFAVNESIYGNIRQLNSLTFVQKCMVSICNFIMEDTYSNSSIKSAIIGKLQKNKPKILPIQNQLPGNNGTSSVGAGGSNGARNGSTVNNHLQLLNNVDKKEKELFKFLFEQKNIDKYNALIDVGGYILNTSVEKMVHTIYEYFDGNKKIYYVNQNGEKLIYNGLNDIILYDNHLHKSDEIFIYYDNKHIIGIDFKQPLNMNGLVLIHKHNKLTEVAQGIFRLRKVNITHTIDFYINKPSDFSDLNELYEHLKKNGEKHIQNSMYYMDIQLIKYLTRKMSNYDNKYYFEEILTNFNSTNNNNVENNHLFKYILYLNNQLNSPNINISKKMIENVSVSHVHQQSVETNESTEKLKNISISTDKGKLIIDNVQPINIKLDTFGFTFENIINGNIFNKKFNHITILNRQVFLSNMYGKFTNNCIPQSFYIFSYKKNEKSFYKIISSYEYISFINDFTNLIYIMKPKPILPYANRPSNATASAAQSGPTKHTKLLHEGGGGGTTSNRYPPLNEYSLAQKKNKLLRNIKNFIRSKEYDPNSLLNTQINYKLIRNEHNIRYLQNFANLLIKYRYNNLTTYTHLIENINNITIYDNNLNKVFGNTNVLTNEETLFLHILAIVFLYKKYKINKLYKIFKIIKDNKLFNQIINLCNKVQKITLFKHFNFNINISNISNIFNDDTLLLEFFYLNNLNNSSFKTNLLLYIKNEIDLRTFIQNVMPRNFTFNNSLLNNNNHLINLKTKYIPNKIYKNSTFNLTKNISINTKFNNKVSQNIKYVINKEKKESCLNKLYTEKERLQREDYLNNVNSKFINKINNCHNDPDPLLQEDLLLQEENNGTLLIYTNNN